jgi:dTDP-4-amino-4,6-dideoxygalactose transaminase
MSRVPFNVPPTTGRELEYLREVLDRGEFSGNGTFTNRAQNLLRETLGVSGALLTHSCTAALEMAALLADLEPGDEVIMPSFTFVSTANAVVLRRAVPVFVDIREDTLNIDEALIEAALSPRTRAIAVVHYAGICAEMDAINRIAAKHGLLVIEDAAQAFHSTYQGIPAGRLGDMACFSFHETKNVTTGEGGALVLKDARFAERAFVLWEKGTNRRAHKLGQVDKYTWIDQGSSFLPSEFTAALLLVQLEAAARFNAERVAIWNRYQEAFTELDVQGIARRPTVPEGCVHNGHLYYLLLPSEAERDRLLRGLYEDRIGAPFHYIPLHSAPAGRRFARTADELPVTDAASARLIRLPLHAGMTTAQADRVIERVHARLRA